MKLTPFVQIMWKRQASRSSFLWTAECAAIACMYVCGTFCYLHTCQVIYNVNDIHWVDVWRLCTLFCGTCSVVFFCIVRELLSLALCMGHHCWFISIVILYVHVHVNHLYSLYNSMTCIHCNSLMLGERIILHQDWNKNLELTQHHITTYILLGAVARSINISILPVFLKLERRHHLAPRSVMEFST